MSDAKPKNLIIIGAGGLGQEAMWVALEMNRIHATWNVLGYCDDNPELRGRLMSGFPVLGPPSQFARERPDDIWFHCAIGRNRIREKVVTRMQAAGWTPATIIYPSVIIAPGVRIGEGCYIGAGTILAPEATIGNHVLINTLVGIGHHSVIGDFAQVCPGARVNGNCRVDKYAFLGSNSSLQPGITVGEGATVGANSYAIRSVLPLVTVMGVPARIVGGPAKSA